MVYKKIVSNIPSLSSLLLAGVVLGGGCPGKEQKNEAIVAPVSDNVPNKEEDKSPTIVRSKEYVEASKGMHLVLADCLKLGRLAKGEFIVLQDSEYKTANLDVLNNLYASFRGKGYPTAVRKCASADVLKCSAVKKIPLCAELLNEIAKVFYKFHTIYTQWKDEINHSAESDKFLKELNEYYKKVKSNDQFKPGGIAHSFLHKTQLIKEGGQLARFLNDASAGGHSYNVKPVLDQIIPVWVKLETSGGSSLRTNPADYVTDQVHIRGSGIKHAWETSSDPSNMPEIDCLDNIVTLKSVASDWNSLGAGAANPVDEAAIKQDIKFSTFMFTLFKGDSDNDCFKVQRKSDDTVFFEGNQKAFQNLVNFVEKKDYHGFAKYLGNHIVENDLKDFFLIVQDGEVDNYMNQIRGKLNDSDLKDAKAAAGIADSEVPENSVIAKLIINIANKLGWVKGTAPFDMCTGGLMDLADLSGLSAKLKLLLNNKEANVSFENRVYMTALVTICEAKDFKVEADTDGARSLLCISEREGSALDLLEKVKDALDELMEYAILKQESENEYQPTKVTRDLLDGIKRFAVCLKNKNMRSGGLTYADIRKENSDFDISAIKKAMDDDYGLLKDLFQSNLKVDEVLALETKGDLDIDHYTRKFHDISGFTSHSALKLEQLRKSYLNQKEKKSTAPAAG